MKDGGLSRVTVGEGLVPHVESSFFWFTDVEITQDDAHTVGIQRPMRSDGKLWFEVDVDNHETLSPNCTFTQYGHGLGK